MSQIDTDKNVYLLGAGFSRHLGLPLQDDFLFMAKEVFFKNPKRYAKFEKVFDYQNQLSKMLLFLNYPLTNLEHLFNLIEMDKFYSGKGELTEIRDAFIQLICDVLIEKTPSPIELRSQDNLVRRNPQLGRYLGFLRLLIKEEAPIATFNDTIISFNYDLVLENAAFLYNWDRTNGAERVRGDELFKFNILSKQTGIMVNGINNYFPKKLRDRDFQILAPFSDDSKIKLIKLHGSINWETTDTGIPFIIPPTWNKSDDRAKKLWDVAYEEITTAKRLIIFGYSFPETDTYVKSLLALALNENKILQNIIFINPDAELINKTYPSLLNSHFIKHCKFETMDFNHFVADARIKGLLNRSKS